MNPFKVGDKVKVKKSSFDFEPRLWDAYRGFKHSVVTYIENDGIATSEDKFLTHYSHFELYKEEENTMNGQQTKRVPFTHELWEKWRDKGGKVVCLHTGKQVMQLAYFPQADSRFRYAYLTRTGTAPTFGSGESFFLEIPVTTKRIPFNPKLKDAKVFYGKAELTEWFQAKTGVICGTHTVNGFGGEDTSLYHPNDLEMEIET